MNEIEQKGINNRYNWLAERNGIAIASIDSNKQITLNSHAMLIFGVDKSQLNFELFTVAIIEPEKFKNYIKTVSAKTSEYQVSISVKGLEKKYLISAHSSTENNTIDLSIQPLNYKQENAEYLCQFASNSDDLFGIWTPENELLFLSTKFEDLFERNRKELKGTPNTVIKWILAKDLAKLQEKSSQENKNNLEFRISTPNGKIKWVLFQKKYLYDGAGKIYRHLGILSDITRKKEIEQELVFSKYSLDKNTNPIYWFNEKGEIKYTNQAACDMLGYTREEILSKHVIDLSERPIETFKQLWGGLKQKGAITIETEHIKNDGSRVDIEVRASFIELDTKEFAFAYVTDITKQKSIENKIKLRQNFERLLLNISKEFINLPTSEIDDAIDLALKQISEFTGSYSAHIFKYKTGFNSIKLSHSYVLPNSKIENNKIKEDDTSTDSWHFKMLTQDNTVEISNVESLPSNDKMKAYFNEVGVGSFIDIALFYQKKIYGFFGLCSQEKNKLWDQDEIKLLQVLADLFMSAIQRRDFMHELMDSEQNYRAVYNATGEAIFIHNADTGEIEDVNDAMLKMYNISYEKALSIDTSELSANSEEYIQDHPLDLIHKSIEEAQVFEWLAKKTNGETFWTEVSLKRAKINGMPKIVAVVRDISERRKTQQQLKKSESNYRMIVEGQSDLIVKIDKDWNILFTSPSVQKLFDREEHDFICQPFLNLVDEEDRELSSIAMNKLMRPPHSCFFEFRATLKKGARWFAWNYTTILDDNSEITDIIGVGRDISYQKMVENALRESEERFRSIVQNLSDVVFLIDEKASIKYVTPSCQQYLGRNVEELLGYNVLNLIHGDDKWLAEENISLHLDGLDSSLPYELRLKHTSNSWKVFEAKSQNLLDHESVNSIIFTISDITERKQMEKQVLDAIIKTEEKERERFAKDLHDDLGPLLSSIKMYVGMLNKVKEKEKQEYIMKNLQDIVKESIATTKEVSNDLNPHVLNNYGLTSALKLFIEKVSGEITINFHEDIGTTRYSAAIELSLYRISKELINNTLKHANASEINLIIAEKSSKLNLWFEDNGDGLPDETVKEKKPGSMGLSNIASRAKSLNATHSFHTDLPSGFKFEIHVPLVQD